MRESVFVYLLGSLFSDGGTTVVSTAGIFPKGYHPHIYPSYLIRVEEKKRAKLFRTKLFTSLDSKEEGKVHHFNLKKKGVESKEKPHTQSFKVYSHYIIATYPRPVLFLELGSGEFYYFFHAESMTIVLRASSG